MRPRVLALALVATLAVIAIAATHLDEDTQPAQPALRPAPRQLLGVQVNALFADQTPATVGRELDLARASGANVVRIGVGWASLQLTGPGHVDESYSARVDAAVNGARRRGLRVVMFLLQTPCWASSAPESLRQGCQGAWWERGVTAYPPADPNTFGEFAAYAARRWGDRIDALELWNEPNMRRFLTAPDPARAYGAMVRAAYPRVKRAKPRLTVLAGAMVDADGAFLERLFDDGHIAGNYDAVSFHPYTAPISPRAKSSQAGPAYSFRDGGPWLRRIMKRHGDRRAEIWATEAGASTCDADLHQSCVDDQTQARMIRDYVDVARGMHGLRALIVYTLRDPGTDPSDVEQGFGLVKRDFAVKPAFGAFRRALAGN